MDITKHYLGDQYGVFSAQIFQLFYMFEHFHNKMLGERFLKERKGWTRERQRHSQSEQRKIHLKAHVYHWVLLSKSNYTGKKMKKRNVRTSLVLVVQWIRIYLPKQGTWARSWVWKILHAAEQLWSQHYWARTVEPVLCSERTTAKRSLSTAARNSPSAPQLEEDSASNEDPVQPYRKKEV